jgi:hypothetical protein
VRRARPSLRQLYRDTRRIARSALTGRLIRVLLREVTDEFAFSLDSDGWNYSAALIREHLDRPGVRMDQTLFYRFFQDPRLNALRSLDDILYLHDPARAAQPGRAHLHLGTYPWGGITEEDRLTGGTPFGWYYDSIAGTSTRDLWGTAATLWYQPNDLEALTKEWDKTIALYRSLKAGYHPLRRLSFPSVTLLARHDGQRRAIMGNGHHRMTVLACLGYHDVTVEVIQVIEETRVDDWHYVRTGHCSRQQALETFNAFFTLNGGERLQHLGLKV